MTCVEVIAAIRFRCSFCRRSWSKKATAEDHVERCWANPEVRACKTPPELRRHQANRVPMTTENAAQPVIATPGTTPPFAMPDRIAIDAMGYGWRVWDDQDFWSMVPTNPDNSPIPKPVTWFVNPDEATVQRAIDEWATLAGGPDYGGPSLARYIVAKLREAG